MFKAVTTVELTDEQHREAIETFISNHLGKEVTITEATKKRNGKDKDFPPLKLVLSEKEEVFEDSALNPF